MFNDRETSRSNVTGNMIEAVATVDEIVWPIMGPALAFGFALMTLLLILRVGVDILTAKLKRWVNRLRRDHDQRHR